MNKIRDLGTYNGYPFELFRSDEVMEEPISKESLPVYLVVFYPGGRKFVTRMFLNAIAFLSVDEKVYAEFLKSTAFEQYIMKTKEQLHRKIEKITQAKFLNIEFTVNNSFPFWYDMRLKFLEARFRKFNLKN